MGGSHSDYKTSLSSQLDWHWTWLELSLAKYQTIQNLHRLYKNIPDYKRPYRMVEECKDLKHISCKSIKTIQKHSSVSKSVSLLRCQCDLRKTKLHRKQLIHSADLKEKLRRRKICKENNKHRKKSKQKNNLLVFALKHLVHKGWFILATELKTPQSGICSARCVLCQCTVVFAWECHFFCLCAHGQCHVYYIYHVEFHFRFRHLVWFPV